MSEKDLVRVFGKSTPKVLHAQPASAGMPGLSTETAYLLIYESEDAAPMR